MGGSSLECSGSPAPGSVVATVMDGFSGAQYWELIADPTWLGALLCIISADASL